MTVLYKYIDKIKIKCYYVSTNEEVTTMQYLKATMQYSKNSFLAFATAIAVTGMSLTSVMVGADSLPNGVANNPVPAGREVCSLNVGFLIDRSNSIRNDSEGNPAVITSAVNSIVDDLKGTDSQVAVWSFGTKATGYVGANPLSDSPAITAADYPGIGFTGVKSTGDVQAVKITVASIPYESENSATPLRRAGWTNWQAALAESSANGDSPADADVVFMLTDGDPTLPQNTANPDGQNPDKVTPVVKGVEAADAVKSNGQTRIVGFAIGQATSDEAYINNIKRVTGGLTEAKQGQDYFVGDFSELGSMMRDAIDQVCVEQPEKDVEPEQAPKALPNTGFGSSALVGSLVAGAAAGAYVHRKNTRTQRQG
jgi:hypothetical protein